MHTCILWDISTTNYLPNQFSISLLKTLKEVLTQSSSTNPNSTRTSSIDQFRIYSSGLNLHDNSNVNGSTEFKNESEYKLMLENNRVGLSIYKDANPINIERLITTDLFSFILDSTTAPSASNQSTLTILLLSNPSAFYYLINMLRSRSSSLPTKNKNNHKIIIIISESNEFSNHQFRPWELKITSKANLILNWEDLIDLGQSLNFDYDFLKREMKKFLIVEGWDFDNQEAGEEEKDAVGREEEVDEIEESLNSFTIDSYNDTPNQFIEIEREENVGGWIDAPSESISGDAPPSPSETIEINNDWTPRNEQVRSTLTNSNSNEIPDSWKDYSQTSGDPSPNSESRVNTPRPQIALLSTLREATTRRIGVVNASGFVDRINGEGWESPEFNRWPAEFPALANLPPSRTANTSSSYSIDSRQQQQEQQRSIPSAPVSWASALKPSKDKVFHGTILPNGTLVPVPLNSSSSSSRQQQQSNRKSNEDILEDFFQPLIKTLSTFNDPKPAKILVQKKLERLFPRVYDGFNNHNRMNHDEFNYHGYYNWEIYIEEAEKEKIIRMGKNGEKEWIGLRPNIEKERLGGNGRR